MDTRNIDNISVLMLPWLAHGHISPFLDLAKTLCTRNFSIYLCSTPINLDSIKTKITDKWSSLIHLVELDVPALPDLPPHYHTTNGLPPHLMVTLKTAFANSSPEFENIFESVKPDLLIYDFNQPWAADIALSKNVPAVQFHMSSTFFASFLNYKLSSDPAKTFPFPVPLHKYFTEKMNAIQEPSPEDAKDIDRVKEAGKRTYKIILRRTFREIEGKYVDYLSVLSRKKIIPVGSLVQEIQEDTNDAAEIIQFLDKKNESSVVFVSFGSEYFLSKEEIQEIAYGLELSRLNFIWVVRFPFGENMELQETLPLGFLDRVGDRGLVMEGWAPQAKILRHSSTGGFVSHCGWGSIMESMMFGVPVIAMPMQTDQPFNAIVVKEVGVGQEVERDENGRFKREEIAEVIRNVVLEKRGETVRRKAKEMREKIRENGEKEIDDVAEELVKLCKEKKDEIASSRMLQ
ncbi:Glycosyltransferase [Heracleum sosnowskyi]|uniref:Glycosyltransferase n=1 Tax=Heracleum sosnowskyi TaxID=360622 RepID=A0AAD8IBP9_9APIA|nr:Glycosyltransferase [Heracleum sosnowskyi]